MPKPRTGFIIATIITIFLGILAVPQFQIDFGSYQFNWPALDFSFFNIEASIGNMRKGKGIYADTYITYSTEDQLNQSDWQTLSERLFGSSLDELEINVDLVNTGSELNLVAPNYYTAAQLEGFAELLFTKGNVEVWQHNPELPESDQNVELTEVLGDYRPSVSGLSADMLVGARYAASSNFGGSYLQMSFTPEGQALFQQLQPGNLQSDASSRELVIAIDGEPKLFMLDFGTEESEIVAFGLDREQITNSELRLLGTFIGGNSLDSSPSYTSTQVLGAEYAPEGSRWVEIAMLVVLVAIVITIYLRYSFAASFSYDLALAASAFIFIGMMKLGSMPISVATILGFSLIMFINSWWLEELITSEAQYLKPKLKQYKNIAVAMFVISSVTLFSGGVFGVYSEFASAVSLGFFSTAIAAWLIWEHLLRYYFDRK